MAKCKECGADARVTTLGSFRGAHGEVALMVSGMPAQVCANGHKRYLYSGFPGALAKFVGEGERIAPQPPAKKRGFFSKRYHCHECDAELPAVAEKKSDLTLDASLKDASPFKVIVQIALYKCDGCGREQVLSNEDAAASAVLALENGLKAEGVE